jgi:hypothetical protein
MRAPLFCFAAFLSFTAYSFAQERTWSVDQNDNEAYLVFGVPETDDVGVSFWCKLHSDVIRFYAPETDTKLKIGNNIRFAIEVSPKTFRLIGKTSANQEAGSISLESELKIGDPLFTALQGADRFSVNVGKAKQNFPLQDADFTNFLAVCKKP